LVNEILGPRVDQEEEIKAPARALSEQVDNFLEECIREIGDERTVSEEAEKRLFDERVDDFARQLCKDIFPGEKATFTCSALKGSSLGSNNDIHFIELKSGRKVENLVLRTPKPERLLTARDAVIAEILSGWSITEVLASHDIPVPKIVGYSVEDDILGRPYQLMKRLPGKALSDCYNQVLRKQSSWRRLVRDHVDFLAKVDQIEWASFGELKPVNWRSAKPYAGPGTDTPMGPELRLSVDVQLDADEPTELLPLLAHRIKRQMRRDKGKERGQKLKKLRKQALEQLEGLAKLDAYGGVSLADCRLYAWDMQQRNVIVDPKTGHITGFVDWDEPLSYPRALQRNAQVCEHLWKDHGVKFPCGESLWRPLSKTQEAIRQYFQEQVDKAIPGYWNDLNKISAGVMKLFWSITSDSRDYEWEEAELDVINTVFNSAVGGAPVIKEGEVEDLGEQSPPSSPPPPPPAAPAAPAPPAPAPAAPAPAAPAPAPAAPAPAAPAAPAPPSPPSPPVRQRCEPGQVNCRYCGGCFKRGRGLDAHIRYWRKKPSATRRHV
jgi:hypothetical protein